MKTALNCAPPSFLQVLSGRCCVQTARSQVRSGGGTSVIHMWHSMQSRVMYTGEVDIHFTGKDRRYLT